MNPNILLIASPLSSMYHQVIRDAEEMDLILLEIKFSEPINIEHPIAGKIGVEL